MYFWYQVTLAFFAFVPLSLDFPLFLINKWLKLKQTRLTFCERRTPDEVLIVRKRGQPLNERWYQSSLAPQYLKKYLNSNKPIRYISRYILNWKKIPRNPKHISKHESRPAPTQSDTVFLCQQTRISWEEEDPRTDPITPYKKTKIMDMI